MTHLSLQWVKTNITIRPVMVGNVFIEQHDIDIPSMVFLIKVDNNWSIDAASSM